MLTVILTWIYILFTVFCLGHAFSRFSEKVLHYSLKRMTSVLMTGLIIATVYAQIFSLFYRVNIEANVLLVVACVVIVVTMRKSICEFLKNAWDKCPLSLKILIPILFLVWSYFTSRGYRVIDMNLYHGQSIRWIEEYGVVKGLGNLHCRFGYNSSIFAASALYSLRFVFGRSIHAVNGLIAFIISVMALDLGKCVRRKKMLLSDYARVAAVYYLTTIWDEVVAPSSDYAVMCTIFFIVINWLTQLEEEDVEQRNNIAPYALLCVAGVFTLTLKLTASLILILLIKPAYMLIKQKRWKEIAIYLSVGLLVAVPWLARNIIITGWLFYPMPYIDLFDVDWKMTDMSVILTDLVGIESYGKATHAIGMNATLQQWYPNWFKTQLFATEKLLIIGDLLACVATVIIAIITFVKKRWKNLDALLVLAMLVVCFMFWQLSAPLIRYGYAYVLLLAAVTFGYIIQDRKVVRIIYIFLILYGVYKLYIGCNYMVSCRQLPYYIWQESYDMPEVESCELDGVTFYCPQNGDLAGYYDFPAADYDVLSVIELRGDSLKDGFRLIENE